MKASEPKYAVLAKSKDDREHWLYSEKEFNWPTTTRKYIEGESNFNPPNKAPGAVFMFDTEEEAIRHFEEFTDHPNFFQRTGEYRVVKLKEKTKVVDDGWHIDESK